jgi:hypothetical protein
MTTNDSFRGEGLTTTYTNPEVCRGGGNINYKAGQLVGGGINEIMNFFEKHIAAICIIVLLCLLVVYVSAIADSGKKQGGYLSNIGDSLYHWKCKSRGGCGRTCPYTTSDDPRVIIRAQTDELRTLSEIMEGSLKETKDGIPNLVGMFTDTTTMKSMEDKCNEIYANMVSANSNLSDLVSTAKNIDAVFSDSAKISSALVNAKNRMGGIHAAATIMSHYYVASFFVLNGLTKDQFILQQSKEDPGQVSDKLVHKSNANFAKLQSTYTDTFVSKLGSSSDYTAATKRLSTESSDSGAVIDDMVTLLTMTTSTQEAAKQLRNEYEIINDIYLSAARVRFSNKLPGKADVEVVSALIEKNDYDSAVKLTALEPEIASNHAKFAKERASFDSGGGVPSVRDDDNDVIPWVGLFGRPTYRRTDGTSAELASAEPLRSIPSDNPNDLMREKSLRISYA